MTFEKYLKLHGLAERVSSLEEFIEEIGQDPLAYVVEKWGRGDYGHFYERVKGGDTYDYIAWG